MTPDQIKALITTIANEMGVNPQLAIAIAQQESGLNPQSVGDNGTSFGLYNLHEGGELGNLTKAQAFDPTTNIRTALAVVAQVAQQNPDMSPGQIAAAAQRPADPQAYAVAINNAMGQPGAASGGAASLGNATVPVASPGTYNPNQPYETGPALQSWIMQNAGQDAWMLSNPELSNILGYVAQNNIVDPAEIQSLVAQTDWYKTHGSAQQAWTQLYGANPAEASRQIHQAQISIQDQAGQMGVTLTQDQLNTLSIDQNYYGLTTQEMQRAIAQYLPTAQASTTGQAGVDFNSLQQAATLTWGVPETAQQIQQYVQQIESGQQTVQGVEAQFKAKASTLYPQLAQQFSQGLTFDQAVSPYKGIIQQYLNIDPSQVNFMDPKWAQLLSQGPTTGNGSSAAGVSGPSLDQFAQQIRSNLVYGYQNTMNAANEMTGLTNATAKTLGIIGQ